MTVRCCATCRATNCVLKCQCLKIVVLPCDPAKCLPTIRLKCEGWKQ